MSERTRSVLPLIFVTVVIDLIGFGIVIPVLPLYGERFGASPFQVGLLMGVFSGCQLLLAPVFGRLSDRIGRRPILLLSMVGACIGYLIMAMATSWAWLMVARVIQGVSGASISTAQAAIADVTTNRDRSRGMGLIGAAFGIGFVLGPLIGGLMSRVSEGGPFFFAAGLSALNSIFLFTRLPETRPLRAQEGADQRPPVTLARASLLATPVGRVIIAYLFVTTGFSIMTGMFSLFTKDRFSFGELQNGYVFAFIGLIAVLVQGGLIGRLVCRFGEKRLALIGGSLVSLSLAALPLAATVPGLIVACAGLALGNSLITPTLNGLASRSIDAHSQGRVLGVLQASGSLGRMLGPFLGGVLYHWQIGGALPGLGQAAFWAGSMLCAGATVALVGMPQPVESVAPMPAAEVNGTGGA